MLAVSKNPATIRKGLEDLRIEFRYTPPDGEDRAGITIRAVLTRQGAIDIEADVVTFDADTGEVLAVWEEATTARLFPPVAYDAVFVRAVDGVSRAFFVRRVQVL